MELPHADITVIAHPGSRKDAIAIDDDGTTLVIHVTAPPEKGKANKAIMKLLARYLGIGPSNISILRGSTSSTKILRVDGMNNEQLMRSLDLGIGRGNI
ncbi:MAG: DUF167 domain-containing protein [Candidatus Sigynarchaeota archaeon]